MTDRYRDDVEALSLPGHDRDCALAMLSQSRLRHSSRIDEIQVAHLVAIGYRAGRAVAEARVRAEVAEEIARELEVRATHAGLATAASYENAAKIARSHAGSSPDTTPEGKS